MTYCVHYAADEHTCYAGVLAKKNRRDAKLGWLILPLHDLVPVTNPELTVGIKRTISR